MTTKEARKFGRAEIVSSTCIAIATLLVVFFFTETQGDSANGMLFFMEAMANIHLIFIVFILFGLSYVLGGMAGKDIIIARKNFIWPAIRCSIIIVLAIEIYAAAIGFIKMKTLRSMTVEDHSRPIL